jgi:hypothetical protein
MNWEAVGAVGEGLGGVLVIFSLIYLGVQVKQSGALARATAQRDLYQDYQGYLSKLAEEADIVRQGLHDFSSLKKSEALTFNMCVAPFINHLDQTIRMHKSGFETQDNVDLYGGLAVALVCTPGGREWWKLIAQSLAVEGRRYIEERLASPETLPPPLHETLPFMGPDDPD